MGDVERTKCCNDQTDRQDENKCLPVQFITTTRTSPRYPITSGREDIAERLLKAMTYCQSSID